MNILLWILQVLMAALFIFAGVMKFIIPVQKMTEGMKIPMPGWLLLFIGVVEILGGLGLLLPGIFKIKPILTPLAAIGLTIIMIGAVAITIMGGDASQAITPFIVGILCAFIAYGRLRLRPIA